MAMPVFILAFHLPQDVPHGLLPCPLRHQTILWPVCQVLQVERQVVLRTENQSSKYILVIWSQVVKVNVEKIELFERQAEKAYSFCEVVQIHAVKSEEIVTCKAS